jgi:hypothetical protein
MNPWPVQIVIILIMSSPNEVKVTPNDYKLICAHYHVFHFPKERRRIVMFRWTINKDEPPLKLLSFVDKGPATMLWSSAKEKSLLIVSYRPT